MSGYDLAASTSSDDYVEDPYADVPLSDDEPDDPEAPKRNRRLIFRPASTITPRPVRWAWDTAPQAEPAHREGRVPIGSLCLAVGRASVGKSQFAAWMTARVTTGTLPGAYYGQPHAVIYCATEDSWEMTIVPRLTAAGAHLDRVYHVAVQDDDDMHARLTLPSDIRLLERGIVEHQVGLVVMDPLLSLIDATINDYRAREVRDALEPLVALADRTRVTLFALAHFTKGIGSDPLMLVSGSAAFGQLVRSALAFAKDDEGEQDTYVMSTIKNNLGRENLPSLAYEITPQSVPTPEGDAWVSRLDFTGEQAERSVRDLLRNSAVDAEERTEQNEVAEWLKGYLTDAGGAAAAADVIKAAKGDGIAERTLQRARKAAGVTSARSGFPARATWSYDPVGPQSGLLRLHVEHGTTGTTDGPTDDEALPDLPAELPHPQCSACGKTTKEWVLRERGGLCIDCGRSTA